MEKGVFEVNIIFIICYFELSFDKIRLYEDKKRLPVGTAVEI